MPTGRPSRGLDHFYGEGYRRQSRAALTQGDARRAAQRVLDLTGRRYSAYECTRCGAWHIRPCRLRPADLAVPA